MIKVMQVGYGYWGANVAKKLLESPMTELVYLVENNAERRENARKQVPESVILLEDYRTVLEKETDFVKDSYYTDVDAVVICTQTEYSYEIAMKAMECGKHIFVEKPIATNVARTQKLIAKAEEKQIVLHCDHLMVYNPVIQLIKKMIEQGEIGDIMYIDISRINLGPIRKDINAMLDLAVHDIAVVDYLLGGMLPDTINVQGTKILGGEQETITYLLMKYKDILVHINSSWISPVKVRKMVIAGTKKMLIFDDVKMDKLAIYDSGINVVQGDSYGEYEYKTRTGDIFIPHIDNQDSLRNSLEHFADCILNRRKSLSGPEQSLRVMKVLEKAQKSLREGEGEFKNKV